MRRVNEEECRRIASILKLKARHHPHLRLVIEKHLNLMDSILVEDLNRPSPKKIREELHHASEALKTLSDLSADARFLFDKISRGTREIPPAEQLQMLATDVKALGTSLKQRKGGLRPWGPSPRAKGLAVYAASNFLKEFFPHRYPKGMTARLNDRLVKSVGVATFSQLSEFCFELLMDSTVDCVGQLERQIRDFRRGKLDLDQGLNLTSIGYFKAN